MANYVEQAKSAIMGSLMQLTDAQRQAYVNGNISSRTISRAFANATAGTAVTESAFEDVRRGGIVRSVTITAPIAVAVDATNNATILVQKRTISGGAAGAAATIATVATTTAGVGAGGLVAFVPFSVPLTAANVVVGPDDVLTYSVTKGGTGVALTAATSEFLISVDFEENGFGAGGP